MDLGAKVTHQRLVLPAEKHAGERRDAEVCHRRAQVQPRLHVDLRRHSRAQGETVSAGDARAIEQRVDDQRGGAFGRALQPERLEGRELLARAADGVDGQAARRQAVMLPGTDRAQVARALEQQHLVLVGTVIERVMHPKAGHLRATLAGHGGRCTAVIEGTARHLQRLLATVDQFVQLHGPGVAAADMKKLQLERQPGVAPPRGGRTVADVAVVVVVQRGELGVAAGWRRLVGPVGQHARTLTERVEVESGAGVGATREQQHAGGKPCRGAVETPRGGGQLNHGQTLWARVGPRARAGFSYARNIPAARAQAIEAGCTRRDDLQAADGKAGDAWSGSGCSGVVQGLIGRFAQRGRRQRAFEALRSTGLVAARAARLVI